MQLRDWLGPPPNVPKSQDQPVISVPTLTRETRIHPAKLHTDNYDAVMRRDTQTTQAFAAGGLSAGVPAFRESPASAAATLADYARRDSNFDPTALAIPDTGRYPPPSAANSAAVSRYFSKLQACPLLGTEFAPGFYDYDGLAKGGILHEDVVMACIFAPVYLRPQFVPSAWDDARTRLQNIVNNVATGGESVYLNPFYASVLVTEGLDVAVHTIVATLKIWRSGSDVEGYAATNGLIVGLRHRLWPDAAGQVAEQHYQSVVDWLASN